jgi:hypothetical protein
MTAVQQLNKLSERRLSYTLDTFSSVRQTMTVSVFKVEQSNANDLERLNLRGINQGACSPMV